MYNEVSQNLISTFLFITVVSWLFLSRLQRILTVQIVLTEREGACSEANEIFMKEVFS